jgi:hypothetical protein
MRKLMILAVFVCGSVYAFADPTEFTFIGWNDGNWQNGYPYYIEASNGSPTILNVMCDDYAHGGMPGDQWDANITDLGKRQHTANSLQHHSWGKCLIPADALR